MICDSFYHTICLSSRKGIMQNKMNNWDELETKIYNTAKLIKKLEQSQEKSDKNKLKLLQKDFHKMIKFCFKNNKVESIYKVKDEEVAEIIDDFVQNEVDVFEFNLGKKQIQSSIMLMPITIHSEKELNPVLRINDIEDAMREILLDRGVIEIPENFKLSSFRCHRDVLTSFDVTNWWDIHHAEFEKPSLEDLSVLERREEVSVMQINKSLTVYFAPLFIEDKNNSQVDFEQLNDLDIWEDFSEILTKMHVENFNQYDADISYEVHIPKSIDECVNSSFYLEQNIAFENFMFNGLAQDMFEYAYTRMVNENGESINQYLVCIIDAEDQTLVSYFRYDLGDLTPLEFLEDMSHTVKLSTRNILWSLDEKISEATIKAWAQEKDGIDFSKMLKKSDMVDIDAGAAFMNYNINSSRGMMH